MGIASKAHVTRKEKGIVFSQANGSLHGMGISGGTMCHVPIISRVIWLIALSFFNTCFPIGCPVP
jgi:hypothetical protein